MTDHSSNMRLSPGKPLSITPAPVLTPLFNYFIAPDKTTGSALSGAVVETSLSCLNRKKLVS